MRESGYIIKSRVNFLLIVKPFDPINPVRLTFKFISKKNQNYKFLDPEWWSCCYILRPWMG